MIAIQVNTAFSEQHNVDLKMMTKKQKSHLAMKNNTIKVQLKMHLEIHSDFDSIVQIKKTNNFKIFLNSTSTWLSKMTS